MRKIVLFAMVLLFTAPVFAQTTYLAGIDEAIDIAMRSSGELRATQARFGISQAKVFSANSRLNPVLITDAGIPERSYRVGIQMIFETAGKRKKRKAAAEMEHQVTQDEIMVKMLDIKASVRKTYVELYSAQTRTKALQETIAAANILLEEADKKLKAGSVPELDVVQSEMIKLNAEIELQKSLIEIQRANSALNYLLGNCLCIDCVLGNPVLQHNFKDIATLNKDQHDLNLKQLQQIAYEHRPELKLKADSIVWADKRLESVKANRIPNFLISSGPDFAVNKPGTLNFGAFIMGAVEIPIFDQKIGPIKEVMADKERYEKEYECTKEMILREIRDSYYRIQVNTCMIEKYEKELLPRAQYIIKASTKNFEAGIDDIVVPLMAHDSAMKIQFDYIKAVADYQSAISDLERAIGTSL